MWALSLNLNFPSGTRLHQGEQKCYKTPKSQLCMSAWYLRDWATWVTYRNRCIQHVPQEEPRRAFKSTSRFALLQCLLKRTAFSIVMCCFRMNPSKEKDVIHYLWCYNFDKYFPCFPSTPCKQSKEGVAASSWENKWIYLPGITHSSAWLSFTLNTH